MKQKLSETSAKNLLGGNQMTQQMGTLGMGTGTGTGTGDGLGTNEGSFINLRTEEGSVSKSVSFTPENGDITWNGTVTAYYEATFQRNDITNELKMDVGFCNYNFSFRGRTIIDDEGQNYTITEGLNASGSFSQFVQTNIEFVVLKTTYKRNSNEQEEVVSSTRESFTKHMTAELKIGEMGNVELEVSLI